MSGSTSVWHVERRTELLQEIGKVTVRWAALDLLLVEILSIALNNVEAARSLVFDGVGAGKQRLDVFNRAIGISRFDQADRIAIFMVTKTIEDLMSERNRIVHSPIVTSFTVNGKAFRLRLMQVGRGKEKEITTEDVSSHVGKIGLCLNDLETMLENLSLQYLGPYEEPV